MIATGSPSVFVCLALFFCTCHQTFAFTRPILTRHEQCKANGFDGGCDFIKADGSSANSCTQLRCARRLGELSYVQRFSKMPQEGTYCGPFSYCSKGKCVHSDEESKKIRYTNAEYNVPGC
ncbi:uncharacterized protein [Venturia canescens]|uniref:uncharacterized protein n=1 Tax=Venturia canescens TaxID=32260 RepID=UPI001C9D60DF|nr:uncharacterized protein LOC122413391 [Venturia canescens]